MKREGRDLEYKESLSNSFLKTVSAFANYGTGRIIFGVADDGRVVGLPDAKAACLNIENSINDAIEPRPEYSISLNDADATVTLTVFAGQDTPYLYRGKAYRRADSASAPIDRIALERLILKGKNLSYDELPCSKENLTFEVLARHLREAIGVSQASLDVLRTLGLFKDPDGYTNAADILADANERKMFDIARFHNSEDEIAERHMIEGVSLLEALAQVMEVFDRTYAYEKVDGVSRTRIETIPRKAFREAVANALAHRTWDVNRPIQIGMFQDRVRIVSPGGLPRASPKRSTCMRASRCCAIPS